MGKPNYAPRFIFLKRALLFYLLAAGVISAQEHGLFYKGLSYGSDRLFNPVNVILNGSFDIIQLANYSRDIGNLPYGKGFTNVWRNISDPFGNIKKYGWYKFIRDEIFPLDFSRKNAQWWPNYQLHLVGGGMTYAALQEWYRSHGISEPEYFAIGTAMLHHLLNEVVENGSYAGVNVDPISDIWIFDIGGIVLFSSENVRTFFSKELNLSDWSMQPSLSVNNGYLHNNGQYFSIKWFPFREKQYGLFYYFGINGLTGLSYKLDDEYTFSGGIGLRAKRNEILDQSVHKQSVETVMTSGLFIDRLNSLLASVFLSNLSDYYLNLNVYPGVLKLGQLDPGLWVAMSKNGKFAFGFNLIGLPSIAYDTFKK